MVSHQHHQNHQNLQRADGLWVEREERLGQFQGVCTCTCGAAGKTGDVWGEGGRWVALCAPGGRRADRVRLGGGRKQPVIFTPDPSVAAAVCLTLTPQTHAPADCGSGSSFQSRVPPFRSLELKKKKKKHSQLSLKELPSKSSFFPSFVGNTQRRF